MSQSNPLGKKGRRSRWLAGVKPPLGDRARAGTSCRGLAHQSNKGAPRGEAEPEDNPALSSDEEGLGLSFFMCEMTPNPPWLSLPHRKAVGTPNEAQTCLPSRDIHK